MIEGWNKVVIDCVTPFHCSAKLTKYQIQIILSARFNSLNSKSITLLKTTITTLMIMLYNTVKSSLNRKQQINSKIFNYSKTDGFFSMSKAICYKNKDNRFLVARLKNQITTIVKKDKPEKLQ